MSPEELLAQFGYLAVFLGTFLEGEVIVVAAGFFASRGHLNVFLVAILAFAGSYVGHLFWFWLGRRHGVRVLDRFPRFKRHFGSGVRVFERYGAGAIVITQWLAGLRITAAVIIGMSRITILKFVVWEAVSCALWSVAITYAGYYFGHAIQAMLGRIEHLELYVFLVLAVVMFVVWVRHRRKESETRRGDRERLL